MEQPKGWEFRERHWNPGSRAYASTNTGSESLHLIGARVKLRTVLKHIDMLAPYRKAGLLPRIVPKSGCGRLLTANGAAARPFWNLAVCQNQRALVETRGRGR